MVKFMMFVEFVMEIVHLAKVKIFPPNFFSEVFQGCDGIIGSGLKNDSCGVCGGKNECQLSTGTLPIITINRFFRKFPFE